MATQKLFFVTFLITIVILTLLNDTTEARYLPTRSSSDRVDKLKELLKEVSKIRKVLPILNHFILISLFKINQFD